MPIRITYGPPAGLGGQAGLEAGRGRRGLLERERTDRLAAEERARALNLYGIERPIAANQWMAEADFRRTQQLGAREQKYALERMTVGADLQQDQMAYAAALRDTAERRSFARNLPLPGEPNYDRVLAGVDIDIAKAEALGDLETAQRLRVTADQMRLGNPLPGEEMWKRLREGEAQTMLRALEANQAEMTQDDQHWYRQLVQSVQHGETTAKEAQAAASARWTSLPWLAMRKISEDENPISTVDIMGQKVPMIQGVDGSWAFDPNLDRALNKADPLIPFTLPDGSQGYLFESGLNILTDPKEKERIAQGKVRVAREKQAGDMAQAIMLDVDARINPTTEKVFTADELSKYVGTVMAAGRDAALLVTPPEMFKQAVEAVGEDEGAVRSWLRNKGYRL